MWFTIIRHMFSTCKKIVAALGIALYVTAAHAESPWRFQAGVSAGRLTPVIIETGIGYKAALLHIGGFGFHNDANDFWCGVRGGLDWTFLRHLPFRIDAGIGAGYEYAQAPNKMHQAVNKANKAKYLYPYNYKESLDVSAEMRIHLFGFFTQIDIPLHNFMEHDAPDMLWRIGYMIEF
ncbi:MAG: hypothetical protein IKP90_07225 [Fibrobacter sp.]|nr:hypothetical protein [Fibrobacter sp.]